MHHQAHYVVLGPNPELSACKPILDKGKPKPQGQRGEARVSALSQADLLLQLPGLSTSIPLIGSEAQRGPTPPSPGVECSCVPETHRASFNLLKEGFIKD